MMHLLALLLLFGPAPTHGHGHACKGGTCHVCTNCRACRHCAIEGGTCSVKGHPVKQTWKRKKVAKKHR